MADPNNQGQFGNREDTVQRASEGGQKSHGMSGGKFQKGSMRAKKAGKKGGSK